MTDLFVGRQAELRTSLALLAKPGEGNIQDIAGVNGVGKTSYLERLAKEAQQLRLPGLEVSLFHFDMRRHGLGEGFPPGDLGANASLDMLWEVFNRSRQLMGSIAEDRHEFDGFLLVSRNVLREADKSRAAADINLQKNASIGTAEIIAFIKQDEGGVRQRIRELQSQLDDKFVEAWAEFTARRRVLITLDQFQLVADNELGQWFIRLALRLRNSLVVLSRTPSATPLWREPGGVNATELPFFTLAEVTEYLGRRLDTEASLADLAKTAHDFTDGHPGGVALVSELIIGNGGAELTPRELRRLLERIPSEGDQRWAELVVLVLDAIHEPALLAAVEAASIAPVFDSGLLAQLTDPGNPGSAPVANIISRLSGLRMLHEIAAISGQPSGRFRLHEFIRQSVAYRLRTQDNPRWRTLHALAAQYYFSLLQDWDADPYDSYGAWFRYEDERWQEYKREWLHYSGLGGDGGALTRARFTLVFLEAFWWWGYYLPFPFMRRLLEDWTRATSDWARVRMAGPVPLDEREDPNELLLERLTDLINDYPVTHVKPPTAPWATMRENLLHIRELCGLRPTGGLSPALAKRVTAEEKTEVSRTDAFLTLFIAQTRRFQDRTDPKAEQFYQQAADAFSELGDTWTSAWIVFERADMAMERGELERSAKLVAQAGVLAAELAGSTYDEWDHELVANLHRTWADMSWHKGDLDRAAQAYGNAVAHAYWFQGDQPDIDNDGPHGPDEYTQQFYAEMTSRAAERIAELASDPAAAQRFIEAMWPQVPHDGGPSPAVPAGEHSVSLIRDAVFLPGPTDGDLRRVDRPFMRQWRQLRQDQGDPLTGLATLTAASLERGGQ